jgi:ectoine hydroxylase-related dioxygenase (phytanoyl-CoA dioxygenase family)
MPNDPNYRFHTHQDYPFNNGSLNSLVIWIPLQKTEKKEGCLMVAPGSHKKKKIFKTDKNLIIKDDSKFKFIDIPCELGECLIFSQFLVHRSGINTSDNIRFSVQLRVNDLYCNNYSRRFFFVNKAN